MNIAANVCQILEYSEDRVFVSMPLGIPDPNQSCESVIDDHRGRIKYGAQTGFDCQLRGLQIIGFTYGTQCNRAFTQNQKIESIVENYYKQFNFSTSVLLRIRHIFDNLKAAPDLYVEVARNKILNTEEEEIVNLLKDYMLKKAEGGSKYSAYDFAIERYAQTDPWSELFVALKVDPNREYKNYTEVRSALKLLKKDSLQSLDLSSKIKMLNCIAFQACFKNMGLSEASWNPTKSVKDLICEIAHKGPLLFNGTFVDALYKDPPFRLKKNLFGRQIWGWRPNAQTRPPGLADHAIIVVGALSNTEGKSIKELVYFRDVSEESDPDHPENEKIYVMSYDRFKRNASNLWHESDEAIQSIFRSYCINYAVYNPLISLQKI